MGLYDYLNGEQVKCFTSAIVHISTNYEGNDTGIKEVTFSEVGGGLSNYKIGSKVPCITPHYNYGTEFCVFDYRGDRDELSDERVYTIHYIKEGKVFAKYDITEIPEDLEIKLVINNFGLPLNIRKVEDFIKIKEDADLYVDGYYTGLKEPMKLFNIYIETLREEKPDEDLYKGYNEKLKEVKSKTIDIFNKKWLLDDNLTSNNIGYFISVIMENRKDIKEVKNLLDRYKLETKDFDKEVVEYKEWVKGFLSSEEVDKLLSI